MKPRNAGPRDARNVPALALALAVGLLATQAALAQPPGPPRGGPPIERLAEELNLDATQKAEVQRILEEQRAKQEEELRLALSGVLTSEQLAKFVAIQKERRERMRNGPPPPPR